MKGDTYKEVRIFEFEGMTARVYIPDLTEEERARRMKRIHDAAVDLLMSLPPDRLEKYLGEEEVEEEPRAKPLSVRVEKLEGEDRYRDASRR